MAIVVDGRTIFLEILDYKICTRELVYILIPKSKHLAKQNIKEDSSAINNNCHWWIAREELIKSRLLNVFWNTIAAELFNSLGAA